MCPICVCVGSGLLYQRVMDCSSCQFKMYNCFSSSHQQDCGGTLYMIICVRACCWWVGGWVDGWESVVSVVFWVHLRILSQVCKRVSFSLLPFAGLMKKIIRVILRQMNETAPLSLDRAHGAGWGGRPGGVGLFPSMAPSCVGKTRVPLLLVPWWAWNEKGPSYYSSSKNPFWTRVIYSLICWLISLVRPSSWMRVTSEAWWWLRTHLLSWISCTWINRGHIAAHCRTEVELFFHESLSYSRVEHSIHHVIRIVTVVIVYSILIGNYSSVYN